MSWILNIFLMFFGGVGICCTAYTFWMIKQNIQLKDKVFKLEMEKQNKEQRERDALEDKMKFVSFKIQDNLNKKVIGITGDGELTVAIFKSLEYFEKSPKNQEGIPVLEHENGSQSIHFGKVFLHTPQLERLLSEMSVEDRKAIIWSTYPIGHHLSGIEYKVKQKFIVYWSEGAISFVEGTDIDDAVAKAGLKPMTSKDFYNCGDVQRYEWCDHKNKWERKNLELR